MSVGHKVHFYPLRYSYLNDLKYKSCLPQKYIDKNLKKAIYWVGEGLGVGVGGWIVMGERFITNKGNQYHCYTST